MMRDSTSVFDLIDSVDDSQLDERSRRIREYLQQQKEEILERLQQQDYQIVVLRKNRYNYCIEELEEGLNMYNKGVRNLLGIFFPLMMEERYMSVLCEGEISAKVMQLRSTIDKNWTQLYKQLVRARDEVDLRSRKIKREEQPTVKKGPNCKIPIESTCILQKWLLENFNDPYPSNAKKAEMARQSNLSIYQVNNWFINARERVVKKFHKKEGNKLTRELSQI